MDVAAGVRSNTRLLVSSALSWERERSGGQCQDEEDVVAGTPPKGAWGPDDWDRSPEA